MSEHSPPPKHRFTWPQALRLFVTLALLGVILAAIPLDQAWQAMGRVNLLWLAIALAWTFLLRATFALRWHLLLAPAGVRHSYLHTLVIALIGMFYDNFAPANLGGDMARSYLAADGHSAKVVDVAASVVADRTLGLISLVLLGFASSALLGVPQLRLALWVLLGTGVAGLSLAWILARRTVGETSRSPLRRVADKLSELSRALLRYRQHRVRLTGALLLSCLGICVGGVALSCWSRAFGFDLKLTQAVAIVVISSVVAMIPITINGLGLTDGAAILLLGWAGMGRPEALAQMMLQRIAVIALSLLGAGLQFLRR